MFHYNFLYAIRMKIAYFRTDEMNFLKSRSGYPRDMEASPDHHLEKWKRDVSSELQSLNRKFNQLNSRDEDTMVHIEDKNSSLASSISDL